MRTTTMATILAGVMLTLIGCTEQTRSAKNYHVRRVTGVSKQEALRTGKATLGEYNFRLDEENLQRGSLRSVPNTETMAGGTGRIRDATVQYPNRVRRTVLLEIIPQGDAVELMCKVLLERLDTADVALFRRERGTNDVPSDTPIEESGGRSGDRQEVWTLVRRDRELERQIMSAWTERLVGRDTSPE